MIVTFHFKLVDFASQTFVDYVAKFFTLSTTVRAAFLTMLLEPFVQTRFTKMLATAYSQVRFTESLGADLTNETIWYFTNEFTLVSTLHRHRNSRRVDLGKVGGATKCDDLL